MPDEQENVEPRRRREDWMPEPSNFELARRIDDVRDELRDGFRGVAINIAALKFVSLDRYVPEHESLRKEIADVKADNAELKADAKYNRRALIALAGTFAVQLLVGAIWLFVDTLGASPP